MRRILSSMLQKEKGVMVSDSTGNSSFEWVESKIKDNQPDLLFLGVDRTDSDKMKLFYQLRNAFPDLHIVLLTLLNEDGAKVALQGLKNGAIDYITKPEKNRGLILADRHFHKRVISLLKSIPKFNGKNGSVLTNISDRKVSKEFFKDVGHMNPVSIELVVIGSCMGGVSSIYQILAALPENLSVPVIIVQHMPKIYTQCFSNDLNGITRLTVEEAKNDVVLEPGTVYVAPGGFHTVIKNEGGRKRIMLHKGPREHKCRPSIDVLLRSAVQEYGDRVLGIFLSGGGNDGVLGALKILEHGGVVLLESRESALISDLAMKVKYLNSEIREVSADKMSKEIMKCIKSADQKNTHRFTMQDLNTSNRYYEQFKQIFGNH
ncbi:response regulator [Rhodohalobacter sp. SW132]|nr:response regulator [Rhodohalobacter sp. SW132]